MKYQLYRNNKIFRKLEKLSN